MEYNINGKQIRAEIFDKPEYNLLEDRASLDHVTLMIQEGYIEGELFDYTTDKNDSRGWWEIVKEDGNEL